MPTTSTTSIARENINAFFDELSPWLPAYKGQVLSFFGVEKGDAIEIWAAQLNLRPLPMALPPFGRAGRFVFGSIDVRRLAHQPRPLVCALVDRIPLRIAIGRGLVLPSSDNADVSVAPPTMLHAEGLAVGRRLSVLEIFGGALNQEFVQPRVDWELKAARSPFDTLNELLITYQIRAPLEDRRRVSVLAHTATEVLAESKLSEGSAEIGLWLPVGLRVARSRLNYRIIDKGKTTQRGCIEGRRLAWERRGSVKVGTTRLAVPRSAVVNCIAVYADRAHHSSWIGDPTEFQNPRLAALETVDSGLQALRSYLLPTERRGAASRHFESAVSWLLWAYGLSTAHLGYADLLKEGPDIIAVAPSGGMLVVECTLGILKEDNKLPKVARRALAVRERLAASGFPNTQVLPVLITALQRREIEPELDAATDSGVLVLCREELEGALRELVALQDGDQVFRKACQLLATAKEERERRKSPGTGDMFPGILRTYGE